jgi:hypothetical protein
VCRLSKNCCGSGGQQERAVGGAGAVAERSGRERHHREEIFPEWQQVSQHF